MALEPVMSGRRYKCTRCGYVAATAPGLCDVCAKASPVQNITHRPRRKLVGWNNRRLPQDDASTGEEPA